LAGAAGPAAAAGAAGPAAAGGGACKDTLNMLLVLLPLLVYAPALVWRSDFQLIQGDSEWPLAPAAAAAAAAA
jgi:hypothetical protein